MPRFDENQTGESTAAIVKHSAGHFGYSGVRVTDLLASEYTLATFVFDVSGSTDGFEKAMEEAAKKTVRRLKDPTLTPKPDQIMLRVLVFSDTVTEVIPWMMLADVDENKFDGMLKPSGWTASADAMISAVEGTYLYAEELVKNDYSANGILFMFTDGCENKSKFRYHDPVQPGKNKYKYVVDALTAGKRSEKLESLLTILVKVRVADAAAKRELEIFEKEVGFSQAIDVDDPDKLVLFVSGSVSSQSKALGTKRPSQLLPPPTI